MSNISVNCGKIEISNDKKICIIAGPCQLETEQHAMDMAGKIKEIAEKYDVGFIYKTSFDKANRTSLKGKRGAGLDTSLPVFDKIKKELSVPILTDIHNIELSPNAGGKLVRSAGASAQISGSDDNYCIIKLNSGELRKIINTARATIGSVSNTDHQNIKIGKAGRNRWKGKRPSVRGVAMNPVDHPHGGGEGKTSGGRSPVSPWGQSAKGL